jgi:hypothetical protein
MALQSRLFSGDNALESCLVKDADHLVEGTRGPHVNKIQQALVLLDGALIEGNEVSAELYGRSTANAVLAYKRKRRIINPAYQTTPDNIVGRMTIASLDKEMALGENRPPLRGCITDIGGGSSRSQVRAGLRVGDSRQLEFAPARLNVAFQEALLAGETIPGSSLRTVLLVERATKLLAPFNLQLSTIFLASFSFAFTVGERDEIDVRAIRNAAQNASSAAPSSLRVIFCHLRNTDSTATSQGERTGVSGFKNFVLINKDRSHPDNGTLLHEMIHCSNDRFMNDFHDTDQNSVFSRGDNRNLLTDDHARSLDTSFFKS